MVPCVIVCLCNSGRLFRSRTLCYSGRVFNMMIGTIRLFNRKLLCKSGRLFHWRLFCYGGIPFNRTLFGSSEMSFTSMQFKTVIGCSKGSCCASLEGCSFVSRCVSVADCALVSCFFNNGRLFKWRRLFYDGSLFTWNLLTFSGSLFNRWMFCRGQFKTFLCVTIEDCSIGIRYVSVVWCDIMTC